MSSPESISPEYGWYGDDFTGATDTLAELARRGMRSLLFLSIPDAARLRHAGPLDAVGIAGASRAMTPEAMTAELEPVGQFFRRLGVRMMHYKCCSTFDSAPGIGSIGCAVSSLQPFFPNPFRPIVGGQPNLGRYLLFGNLFAAAGTGAAVHRIDRHPTMRAHPVTPMGEADLRLHLAAQGLTVSSIGYPNYDKEGVVETALAKLLRANPDAVLLDVSRVDDLLTIGRLLREHGAQLPMLAIGPSGVAQAWCSDRSAVVGPTELRPKTGPVLVLAGSLSPVTRRQVAEATAYRHLTVDPARLIDDVSVATSVVSDSCRLLASGEDVLIVTASPTATDSTTPPAAAAATASLLARILSQHPVRRLGIAGGDTSSLGAQALDLWGLSHAGSIAPGVVICRGHSDTFALDGMEIMLKGGQMGAPDLLAQFRV